MGMSKTNAQLAELVDALVSGTSIRKYVKVRVLYWAQIQGEDLRAPITLLR